MSGVKGRSGGPRPNSGGKRVGAGRKPKAAPKESANAPPVKKRASVKEKLEPQPHGGALKRSSAEPAVIQDMDMLQMLQNVALGKVQASTLQVRAAIAAVQYTHTKRGDGGKKDETAAASKKAAGGRFAPKAPPKLVVSNG